MTDLRTREIAVEDDTPLAYSFCTLVTRLDEYLDMVQAFRARGFTETDCEFLFIDNSNGNKADAFVANNRFLNEAKGAYVVLCHQDVLPLQDDRARLDAALQELTSRDATWAVCGNAGGAEGGRLAYRITHGVGIELNHGGPFPTRVMSVDENFMVVRRSANLALSRDLSGFHWYGADLCVIAATLGWTVYVIDFHLFHKSTGDASAVFAEQGRAFRRKYARAFRPRWHHVPTIQPVFLSSSKVLTFVARAVRRIRRAIVSPVPRELRNDARSRS